MDLYGTLESVGKLKGQNIVAGCHDPTHRYAAYRRGRSVKVVDTAPETPVEVASFKDMMYAYREMAIHPGGERLVVRDTFHQTLTVYGASGVEVQRSTGFKQESTLMSWDGKVLAVRSPAPQWGYGNEHVSFSADGEHVMLLTHRADGQACVHLYVTDTLELVDTLTDLRLYSFYAVHGAPGNPEYVPMHCWSECLFTQDPLEPGLVLAIRNAGDSCLGVMGLRVVNGKLAQVDPPAISKSVLKVDNYVLYALRLLPEGGMLVMDQDGFLARLPWPPDAEAPISEKLHVSEALQGDGDEVTLPWGTFDAYELRPSDIMTITEDHVLVSLILDQEEAVGLAALHPVSLEVLGLVAMPSSRLKFADLVHMGGDLFAGEGASTIHLWRLRR